MEETYKHYTYYSYEEFEEGRGYIGVRTAPKGLTPSEDVEYKGTYKKDGTFNPTGKIIFKTYKTRSEANQAEIYLHDLWDVAKNPHFANNAKAISSGFSRAGVKLSTATKQKLSEINKGKKLSEETKQKIREANKGQKRSEEIKQKMSKAQQNRSEEWKQKISESRKGRKHSEESKQKMSEAQQNRTKEWKQKQSEAQKGRKVSEETRKKLSEAAKNCSEETKLKRSEANNAKKGKKLYNNGEISQYFRDGVDEIPEGFVRGRLPK